MNLSTVGEWIAVGHSGGSIASRMAAAYGLRKYSDYADVVINIGEKTEITGSSVAMLHEEMLAEADFLKAKR
jgi:hypothetical protein